MRWLLAAIVLAVYLAAAPVVPEPDEETINIVPYSSYFMEKERHYRAEEVLGMPETFRPAQQAIYNFGFVKAPIWIRFEVDFSHQPFQKWILRIDNPHIDDYLFYRVENGRAVLLGHNGDTMQCSQNPDCRTFWEPLSHTGTATTYLLHIRTKGSLQIPLVAQTLPQAYRSEAYSNFLFGLYYGVLLLLLVYNLVLYFVVKEVHYLNYLLFLGSYMMFQLNFDGTGREWLWPENTWMANGGLAFFIFLSAMFAFRFARYFLFLKRYSPRTERLIRFAEWCSLGGVGISLLLDYHIAIVLAAVWTALIPWLLIYAGFKVLPSYRAARYYLAGWIVFLLATILVALNQLGLVPTHPALLYAQQIGSLLQMILLSFALADRINMMKLDHLLKLREFNEKLQAKIASKVDEIRQKDQMMIQQSRQAAMGEMIENIAHQWRQPLNQLSLIQSNIFFEHQLGTLDEEKLDRYQEQSEALMNYMTKTIDDFRNFFLPDREKSIFNVCESIERALDLLSPSLKRYAINIEIDCDGGAHAYGHENEFSQVIINIVNNAKDAMVERHIPSPKITIRVRHTLSMAEIYLCDNGGGVDESIIGKIFDPYFTTKFQSQGTGIGLYMVKMIMEKSMEGQVSVENRDDGACFVLKLPKERNNAK